MKKKILFVCIENSDPSRAAEAYSAGSKLNDQPESYCCYE